MRSSLYIIAAMLLATQIDGHSWIEQMVNINEKGEYVGNFGYPRGFQDKTSGAGFVQTNMQNLIPELQKQPPYIDATDPMCHPLQREQKQSQGFPRLQTSPGSWVALRYAENGHIAQPNQIPGRLPGSGPVFVYGTTKPKQDEKMVDVLLWTKDGQGGDKRGMLLGVMDYDDGRCYEVNPKNTISATRQKETPNYAMGQENQGPGNYPLYCESDVQIPKDTPVGSPLTLYWLWQFNAQPSNATGGFPHGRDEYYSTCMDVDVVDVFAKDIPLKKKVTIMQQDAQSQAVATFSQRKAQITDPFQFEMGPIFQTISSGNGSKPIPPKTTGPGSPVSPGPASPTAPAGSSLTTTLVTSGKGLPTSNGLPAITDRTISRSTGRPTGPVGQSSPTGGSSLPATLQTSVKGSSASGGLATTKAPVQSSSTVPGNPALPSTIQTSGKGSASDGLPVITNRPISRPTSQPTGPASQSSLTTSASSSLTTATQSSGKGSPSSGGLHPTTGPAQASSKASSDSALPPTTQTKGSPGAGDLPAITDRPVSRPTGQPTTSVGQKSSTVSSSSSVPTTLQTSTKVSPTASGLPGFTNPVSRPSERSASSGGGGKDDDLVTSTVVQMVTLTARAVTLTSTPAGAKFRRLG